MNGVFQPMRKIIPAIILAGLALPASAQQQASGGARPYTINAGDEIDIYVWGEERLQRTVRILPDGSFSFPLVGKVEAQGQLPSQVEAAISKGLEAQYRGQVPQVTVSVRNPSGMQFSIIGKVRTPGTFTPGRYINALEALALAGGASEFANLDAITVVRKTPKGLAVIRTRLAGAMKGNVGTDPNAIPQIESGDTVIVP
jgi:polysaccharide biosynthesis/export protein